MNRFGVGTSVSESSNPVDNSLGADEEPRTAIPLFTQKFHISHECSFLLASDIHRVIHIFHSG